MPTDAALLTWMLDSDPSLRWQVERDLAGEPRAMWQATRARVATEGMGAALLAHQDDDGQWAGGAYFPADFDVDGPEAARDAGQPWTATTWSLSTLRDWGLDAAVLEGTAEKLAENARWEYDALPYWGGEVDACINGWTLANGAWLGRDMGSLADWVTRIAYPFRWRHTALRAIDYFRAASLHDGTAPDPRLADAVASVRAARQPDGSWLQERRYPGRVWFEIDVPVGERSPWLTFFATRALAWWDDAAGSSA